MAEGLLARVGRWCFRRRWWVVLAWAVAVSAGVVASGSVFNTLADNNNPKHVESVDAYDVLNTGSDDGGQIVGEVDRVDQRAAAVRDAVYAAVRDLAARADDNDGNSPYTVGLPLTRA